MYVYVDMFETWATGEQWFGAIVELHVLPSTLKYSTQIDYYTRRI